MDNLHTTKASTAGMSKRLLPANMSVYSWLISALVFSLFGVSLVDGAPYNFKFSTNPWIRHVAGSDPAANVWGDTVWVYTSMDANLRDENYTVPTFKYDYMDGYHAFSSTDMVNWVDHGRVFHSDNCAWGLRGWMWAPSAHWNGKSGSEAKYYLYYPHRDKQNTWRIGVATAPTPTGPFTDIGAPIPELSGIDPHVFKDDDGQVYMYYNQFEVVKLKDNFVEIAEPVRKIDYGLPSTTDYRFQFEEGSFMHKYKGKYYYSYSHWHSEEPTMAYYAIGDSPYGPFKWEGGLTGRKSGSQDHHSIIEFKGEWWYFTHMGTPWQELEERRWIGQRRISCYQKMYYNDDGTIRRVDPHTWAVNTGQDGPFVASNGVEFYWDQWYHGASNTNTAGSSLEIANTLDDQLYRSYRWGDSFKYEIPVENNLEYIVTFKFAELFHNSIGSRKFNVFLEGEAKITNLDVFAKVGKNAAYDETHNIIVRDHVLNIQFTSTTDYAMIAAIYIQPRVIAPPPTAPIPLPIAAPVPTPKAPVPTPKAPVPTPTAPVPTPKAPAPTAPVPTPTAPVPTPTVPVPTPTAPTPKAPIQAPAALVPTPRAPAPTVPAPVPTPIAPLPTPPAPILPPLAAPVPTPSATDPTRPAPNATPTAVAPVSMPMAPVPMPMAPVPMPMAPVPIAAVPTPVKAPVSTPLAPIPTAPVTTPVPVPIPTGALPTVPPIPIAPPIPVPTGPMAPTTKEPTIPPRLPASTPQPTRAPTRRIRLPRVRSFFKWIRGIVY